ncbi:hypothetical protein SAMN05421666_1034 [Roseovarius nanhaiticus]|uniref:Uncharacterized protein n=1 Tax=Roseovarius nanhaiticus TaxID=573024 RepID=A0A1N7FH89_9RHOB|nr:hypothetical protein [Roseovarius nanhaiticus]SEK54706.1 hypothetical protein SAMN05216208_1102 [Roseovarius nanhaiticus]SIR99596.1 hypothetical protein SAMN05421666_1034 [Roseovarius nanhaiticus]
MALGHLWAGRAYGTNTGNLFVKLSGSDDALTGKLHLNDPNFGFAVYNVSGAYDGTKLKIAGQSETGDPRLGNLSAIARLNPKGELEGEWETDIGARGTLALFPHDVPAPVETGAARYPEQIHTARHEFGAVSMDRDKLLALADEMQADFTKSEVIVTVATGTEQTRLLGDFKTANFGSDRASKIKLYVQQPESNGINRVAEVEFGPQVNVVMVQSVDEALALGILEKLKRHIQSLERTYATNFKKIGFGINQLLVFGAIVFLPSLNTLSDRAALMIGVILIVYGVNWLHRRFLPHVEIYLVPKAKGRLAANALSWIIALTSALAAALLAAYLQGQFPLLFYK